MTPTTDDLEAKAYNSGYRNGRDDLHRQLMSNINYNAGYNDGLAAANPADDSLPPSQQHQE